MKDYPNQSHVLEDMGYGKKEKPTLSDTDRRRLTEKLLDEKWELVKRVEELEAALKKILKEYEPYNVHGWIGPKVIDIAKKALKVK